MSGDFGQHARLPAFPVHHSGACLAGSLGLPGEPPFAAHLSANPRFRQGALPGQNREGNVARGPTLALCLLLVALTRKD